MYDKNAAATADAADETDADVDDDDIDGDCLLRYV